jgi:glycosyltransferase involved in cell wall biosynthesis
VRVLHVARYGSVLGGAETYVRAACDGLRNAGHEVALAYGAHGDEDRPEVRAGFEGLTEESLARAIETFRPDVAHVHTADVAWVAPFVARTTPLLLAAHDHRLACPTGTKYWTALKRACTVRPGAWCLGYNATAHCGSLKANATLKPYREWRAANASARALATAASGPGAPRAATIQVFSAFMRDEVARAGLDASRIAVTPYPVPPAEDARPISAPEDNRPVVFASGRLNKEKGFSELIDAMAYLRAPAHLVIAGEGHERARLERRASTTAGPHRITFTGWLEPAKIAAWRARATIVALPSMWPEPFGIAGIEAMAAGKPVVAFDSGGISEWCEDGVTGRLVQPGALRAFADAMNLLLTDGGARERMGAAAASRARERFSLEAHVGALVSLYEDVCASR